MTGPEYLKMREFTRTRARRLLKDLKENAVRGFDWEVDLLAEAIENGYEAGYEAVEKEWRAPSSAMWRALQLLLVAVADEPEDSIQTRALDAAMKDLLSNPTTARLLQEEVASRTA